MGELSVFKVNIDVTMQKLFIKLPLKLSMPIALSPALPKGPFKMGLGPITGSFSPDPKASVTGQLIAQDQNNEEVFCLNVDGVAAPKPQYGGLPHPDLCPVCSGIA